MKQLVFITVLLFSSSALFAQSDSTVKEKKQKVFIASIKTFHSGTIKGRLYSINDSQVVLSKSIKNTSAILEADEQQAIMVNGIKSFTLIRKNSIPKGALMGLGVGIVGGTVIGLASGDDPIQTYTGGPVSDPFTGFLVGLSIGLSNAFAQTAEEKAADGAMALGVGGAITGTVLGALAKKKFTINGKRESLHNLMPSIMMKISHN